MLRSLLPKRHFRSAQAVSLSVLMAGGCSSSMACSLAAERDYAISRGTLSNALLEVGRLNGCSIVFDPGLISQMHSEGVRGHFSGYDVARMLLYSSGFELVLTANGTLTLQPADVQVKRASAGRGV
ncbi:STN domain-containing protein [Pseudomonas sp. R11F]|uniref:STN domain-containing protein n=1 Tax=Pseudomonas TaxID=286 RepID=UPI00398E9972